jgi:exosortase/archaeosortase family protein
MDSREYSPRDLAVYVAVFAAFYLVFQVAPSLWAELLTARTSSAVMSLVGLESGYGVTDGMVYLDLTSGARPVHVYIIRECSAIHVLGVILGLIVPLKHGGWARKSAAVALGAALVFVMNVSRVVLTVFLTGYDVPPLSWWLTDPTVETYHYPISFVYGVVGIAATIAVIDRLVLPELGDFLAGVPGIISRLVKTRQRTNPVDTRR